MDDATKKMLVTIVGPILRKGLITVGASLSTHGILASNQTETFVSIGMTLIGLGWSFWNDYGRAIVLSQLEVLKAKSLAQAAKLQQHDIAPPTVEQIADKSATLTPAAVAKVAATLCLLLAFGLAFATSASAAPKRKAVDLSAQTRRPLPLTGNIKNDFQNAVTPTAAPQDGLIGGKIFQQLVKPLNDLQKFVGGDLNGGIKLSTLIPDLQDGHGQQCYIAMRSFTAIFKAHPLPATLQAVTDFEAFRLAAAAATKLCHNEHCIQLSVDTVNAIQRTVGPIAAGITPPTLQSLCAYVPDVPLVPALADKDIPADPGASIGAIIPGTGGQMMNPDGSMPPPVAPVTPQ